MPSNSSAKDHAWWKESVVYQVYPASFLSTGAGSQPGWGDIKGITSKLDYLKDLGVDVVWSSPFFRSPQVDLGYDISDYKDIDPRYGSLADIDELIAGLKKRDMKLMVDLVVNHTSDQHPWFLESRASKENPKRDWYHWQPAKYDAQGNRQPPSNWAMQLGEAHSAWTWDEHTQEYYLAIFTPEQPDLNWENPEVRAEVHSIMKFWLDRGACGFRLDVIDHISKVPGYPDADDIIPGAKYQPGHQHYAPGPCLHEYLQEINREVLSKYDTMTVGEMPFAKDQDQILEIVSADRKELNMIFNFSIVTIDNVSGKFRWSINDWKPTDLASIVGAEALLQERGGWSSSFTGNHDQPRSVTRFTDDSPATRELGAKLLALMQSTLGGTLFVYQGEELGMTNMPLSWGPEEYKDIESVNYFQKVRDEHPGDAGKFGEAQKIIQRKGRDHARTPMQWTAGPNAGFCAESVQPWMRVNDNYTEINAAAQKTGHSHNHHHGASSTTGEQHHGFKDQLKNVVKSFTEGLAFADSASGIARPTHDTRVSHETDDHSVYQFWQRALLNRKKHKDVFVYGSYTQLDVNNKDVFTYKRASAKEAFIVLLNFTGERQEIEVPGEWKIKKWVASNHGAAWDHPPYGKMSLLPWEGVLATAHV